MLLDCYRAVCKISRYISKSQEVNTAQRKGLTMRIALLLLLLLLLLLQCTEARI
jgi:hypothetical protein